MKLTGRKGFAYIVSASLILLVVLFTFLAVQRPMHTERQEAYESRIRTMNDFVESVNKDLERVSFISAFRTLMALEDDIGNRGEFIEDIDESFRETFMYGTIQGAEVPLMNDTSVEEYEERINLIAGTMGIKIDLNVTRIELYHTDPWNVEVNITTIVNISDMHGEVYWEYEEKTNARLPIRNLRDPLYAVHTLNRLPNTVRELNATYLVSPENDTSNLQEHINQSYYLASPYAPSFLMRFEGNNSASPYGIESIVNIHELSAQDLTVYPDRAKIDYVYFNNIDESPYICNVESISLESYFVIPSNRQTLYEVSGLDHSTNCP